MAQGFGWLLRHPFALIALPLTAGTTFVGQALIMIFLSEAHAYRVMSINSLMSFAALALGPLFGAIVLRGHSLRDAVIDLLIVVGLLWITAPAKPDDGLYHPTVHIAQSLGYRVAAWSHARR